VSAPDFVVVGHVVCDAQPDGWRIGGTATFAALQAARLGVRAGIVTRAADRITQDDLRPTIEIAGRPSPVSTTFENSYDGSGRTQRVFEQADPIGRDDVPEDWRTASVVLLGPVCGELPPDASRWFHGKLTGASAQGWLRQIGGDQQVRRTSWRDEPFWTGCQTLFVSIEDLAGEDSALYGWTRDVEVVVVTSDRKGARVHADGAWRAIDAYPAAEVDPTGAGDVFAAAFLVRYHETSDWKESTRFASAAAACSVEAIGVEGIAGRAAIEARMAAHPEIRLR
jgi:sugar/nucleoside kinase (ribokinase family)